MRRAARWGLGLALGLVLGSGCWDFDGRYQVVAAELADAGACHQPLCLYASYVGTEVDLPDPYITFRVSAGVVGDRLDDVVVYTSAGDGYSFTHSLLHFVDAGVSRIDVAQQLGQFSRGVAAVGTTSDLWLVSNSYAARFRDQVYQATVDYCGASGDYWGAYQRSASEVYFTGRNSVCRWTGGSTAQQVFPIELHDTTYLNGAWSTPQGELLVAGCEADAGYYYSHVFLLDGGLPTVPEDYDPEDYGLMAISGVGSEVWAASRTGLILKRAGDGSFQTVHTFGNDTGLLDLEAVAANDVWAVGDNGFSAAHWDGASWTDVTLPPAPASTTRWERVHGVSDGLVVAGAMFSPDAGGMVPVVRLYRRGH